MQTTNDKRMAHIEFGWDKHSRQFVLTPWGDRAVDVCRTLKGAEYVPRLKQFFVEEIFWYELALFCRRLGRMPKILRDYIKRPYPDHELGPEASPTGVPYRDYQRVGVGITSQPGGWLLADDMGLGKTMQCLGGYQVMKERGDIDGMLVLGTPSILGQWDEETKKFLGHGTFLLEEPSDALMLQDFTGGIVCCSYPKVWRDPYQEALLRLVRRLRIRIVLDEAHKSGTEDSKQHQALTVLMSNQPFKMAMTGTEVKNQPDSWLAVYKLLTGIRVSRKRFGANFSNSQGKWDETKLARIQVVRNQFGIRRTQEEVLKELPPLTEILHAVPLNQEQSRLLKTLSDGGTLFKIGPDGEPVGISSKGTLGAITREFQITSHPMLVGGTTEPTPKWDVLKDVLDGRGDQQAIVWSYHPETLDWLKERLIKEKMSCEVVHGGVSDKQRDKIRTNFWDKKFDILLANPMSYAEGVNLQCASLVLYWDEHYSKDLWEQSRKRAYRMGQQRPVTIIYLRTEGTIEMEAYNWVRTKKVLADVMIGEGLSE